MNPGCHLGLLATADYTSKGGLRGRRNVVSRHVVPPAEIMRVPPLLVGNAGDRVNGVSRETLNRYAASRSPSCGIVIARAGTTVEMACLYTIWVTVFFSNTTY